MTIFITGIAGFVASHFVDFLTQQHPDVQMIGLKRRGSSLEHLERTKDRLTFFDGDLLDLAFMHQTMSQVRPDKIFHLAAHSEVQSSWGAASTTLTNNIIGQCNLLESVRRLKEQDAHYDPIIHIAGSSEEYGFVKPEEVPITEDNPMRPLSPYAVSKVAQDYMGYQYFQSYGLKIIRTRAFNHSGPRRPPAYVDSSFAQQIARIEKGQQPPVLTVGNLQAVRDFSDVRDVVEAYWLASDKAIPGETYNIASGIGHSIQTVLDTLLGHTTVKDIVIKQDPQRMRPSDVTTSIGDASKFRRQTGWQPKISYLQQTLPDMLEYWRQR